MRHHLPIAVLLLMAATLRPTAIAAADPPAVTVVDHVDLERYTGLWHQVALIPNRFQKQCVSNTTATYTLREDGRIDVLNRCLEADGDPDEADGLARVVDEQTNARLEVSFVSFLGWRPFWGDYWIIGLDEDYRWAVVGTPDRKYGWVLARQPELEPEDLARVREVLAANGYSWDQFETGDRE